MSDLNKVTLIGRLTRDGELKYSQSGFAIMNLSIASNRRQKEGETYVDKCSFFDITVFGKQGEGLKPYLVKGKQIAVSGELRQEVWQQDGHNRSKVVIVADSIQLLGGDKQNTGYAPSGNKGGYQARNNAGYDAGGEDFAESIPF